MYLLAANTKGKRIKVTCHKTKDANAGYLYKVTKEKNMSFKAIRGFIIKKKIKMGAIEIIWPKGKTMKTSLSKYSTFSNWK